MGRNLLLRLMGNETEFSLEHRFLNLIIIAGMMMSFSSALGNYLLKLGSFTVIFPLFVGGLTVFNYYLSMVKRMYYFPVYSSLLTVFFLFYPVMWVLNGGTYGSIPFYVVISTAIISLLTKGWQRLLTLTLYIVFFCLIILAEFHYPELVIPYDSGFARYMDLIIGLAVTAIISPMLFTHILKAYNQEHEKVLALKEEKERLYLNISHDLKTPIAVIMGYVDAIEKDMIEGEKEKREYLKRIQEKSVFLNRLINDIFLLARLEDRQIEFDKQEIDLNNFLERLVNELEIRAREKRISFRLELDRGIKGKLLIDESRVKEAVINIINNAIIYMDKEGQITAGTGTRDGKQLIFIKDNGPGIAEEDLPYIFDRYYSGRHREKGESSGLGLSIAREIIERHGGEIKVRSNPGKGATFYIFLPERSDTCGEDTDR